MSYRHYITLWPLLGFSFSASCLPCCDLLSHTSSVRMGWTLGTWVSNSFFLAYIKHPVPAKRKYVSHRQQFGHLALVHLLLDDLCICQTEGKWWTGRQIEQWWAMSPGPVWPAFKSWLLTCSGPVPLPLFWILSSEKVDLFITTMAITCNS